MFNGNNGHDMKSKLEKLGCYMAKQEERLGGGGKGDTPTRPQFVQCLDHRKRGWVRACREEEPFLLA